MLDLGAFTLGKDGRVLVSEQAHGNRAAREQEKFERDQPLFAEIERQEREERRSR
jgi:hypothetical protein